MFSRSERKHILLATLLMGGVAISWIVTFIGFDPLSLALGTLLFIVSFFGHEIAHKLFAQRNGLWAEFRTNTYGILLTAISIIPQMPFKFLAPGTTSVVGQANKQLQGAIALIGPGFNVVFGTSLILIGVFLGRDIGHALILVGGLNGYIGLFNLLPFIGLDGLKALQWDKTRWAITLVASIALIVMQYLLFA
jgi:Zn-dependent protease